MKAYLVDVEIRIAVEMPEHEASGSAERAEAARAAHEIVINSLIKTMLEGSEDAGGLIAKIGEIGDSSANAAIPTDKVE